MKTKAFPASTEENVSLVSCIGSCISIKTSGISDLNAGIEIEILKEKQKIEIDVRISVRNRRI